MLRSRRAIALFTAAVLATGVWLTSPGSAVDDGDVARVDATANRAGSPVQVADPIDRFVPPRRAVLISDSALAGLSAYGAVDRLTGTDWRVDLAVCRRLVATSCSATGYSRPPTVATELLYLPIAPDRHDLLVVATGYNDSAYRFGSDLEQIVARARAAGFAHVAWLTYRTDMGGSKGSNYASMNAVLRARAADGSLPGLVVWDYAAFTAGWSSWFAPDRIHLTSSGARAIADWLSTQVVTVDVTP